MAYLRDRAGRADSIRVPDRSAGDELGRPGRALV